MMMKIYLVQVRNLIFFLFTFKLKFHVLDVLSCFGDFLCMVWDMLRKLIHELSLFIWKFNLSHSRSAFIAVNNCCLHSECIPL